MGYLLLVIIFYLIVTPLGLVMRMLGRDPMQRKFDRSAASYWIERPQHDETARYFRQF